MTKHPDKGPGEPGAKCTFRRITAAEEKLLNPQMQRWLVTEFLQPEGYDSTRRGEDVNFGSMPQGLRMCPSGVQLMQQYMREAMTSFCRTHSGFDVALHYRLGGRGPYWSSTALAVAAAVGVAKFGRTGLHKYQVLHPEVKADNRGLVDK